MIYGTHELEAIGPHACSENEHDLSELWLAANSEDSLVNDIEIVCPRSVCDCFLDLDGASQVVDVNIVVLQLRH